ncbi:hypothetical protein QL285_053869 [Trifolium repens]|nr:hypothetical protein QL285_053869 [Trifolium repens]
METRLKEDEMERIKFKCGFNSGISVACTGSGRERSGGIALFWNDQVTISTISYSVNHILCSCADGDGGANWFLSGVYGFPEEFNKWKTWQLVSQLSTQAGSNWVCFGDLNDILCPNEKLGGVARSQTQMNLGRQCVEECGLLDPGFEGYLFTWSNGRQEGDNIQCRLDRTLITHEFQNSFSPIRIVHLPRYGSDHAAMMILLKNYDHLHKKKRIKLFRFEQVWTKDNRCEDEVRQMWRGTEHMCVSKLGSMKRLEKVFEDYQISNVRKELKSIEEELKEFNAWAATPEEILRYKDRERRHGELLHTEEIIWRQRSRAVWLKEGDRNTKFFHGKASQRKKVNQIKKLKDSQGVWCHGEDNVERLLIDHFAEIFSTSDPENIDSTCEVVRGKLTQAHKEDVSRLFTTDETGYQPSYAWRSIQSAKEVINLGSRWRIGNGEKVKIFKDKWLPNQVGFKVWSRCDELNEDVLVSTLIDPDTKQWKRDLLSHLFYLHEAKQILSIPISQRLPSDKIIWHFERDGEYSVRSAHHLLKQHNSRNVAGTSGQQSDKLWSEIWKAPVPNRVRNFLWRLAKNILPTRANLSRKGVQVENLCPQCNNAPETIDHLFLHCQLAQLTWFASQIGVHAPQNLPLNSWLLQGLNCEDTMGAQLFCILLWKMWSARNNLIFNQQVVNPIVVAQEAMSFVQELNPSPPTNNLSLLHDNVLFSQQMPSAPNIFYVDAGCFSGTATGWGMIVYNHMGDVVLSACRKELIDVEPVLAEAIGVRWCLQKAIEANMKDIVIASDAATVVNCINSNKSIAVIEIVIQDCKLLIEQLDRVVVTHVRRHLNSVAHGLAKFSNVVGTKLWMGVVPNSLPAALCNFPDASASSS